MEGLDILPLNAPTLNKMRMKKMKLRNSKRVKQETRKKSYGIKKMVYTMEDSEDSHGSEVQETEVLIMGLDTQASNSDSNVEGEVDLRAELISALEELEKCRRKSRQSNHIIN